MRLKIIRLTIIGLFIVLAMGLVSTQVVQGRHFARLSWYNRIRVVPIDGVRGRIFDRNGVVLAGTSVSFDVMVVPQETKDKEKLFDLLSKVLGRNKAGLLKTFQAKTLSPFAPVVVAEDIPQEQAIVLEEHKYRFPGLIVQAGAKRYYPLKDVGAHILGYVAKISPEKLNEFKEYGYSPQEIVGYSGAEEYYNDFLKSTEGGLQVEVNNRGQQTRLLGMKAPQKGEDITLTIDSRIQTIAQGLLGSQRGVIIVMDLDTSEILGMVSSPSYDPNIFASAFRSKERGNYFIDPFSPMLNRAISGLYPPGSVMKIVLALGAVHKEKISLSKTFFCDGSYQLGNRSFRCMHSHGAQNLLQGIAHSCNVYFYNLGLVLGEKIIEEHARLLGLGSLTGIDLPSEAKGLIPNGDLIRKNYRRPWSKGDTLNISVGQGDILVTPLQIVRMIAAVAQKGKILTPFVLKATSQGNPIVQHPAHDINIPEKSFEPVLTGLRQVVEDEGGTGRILHSLGLVIYGKTGTAQTSGGRNTHAWFAGFCPETKTKIAFCVFLEYGGSSYHACLLAKDLLAAMKQGEIL